MKLQLVRYDIILVFLIINTELCHRATAGPSKIKIDSSTRLYIEEQTGRYRMFHGLALENSGSPWYYATYTTEQIKLLKQVTSKLYDWYFSCMYVIHSLTPLFLVVGS